MATALTVAALGATAHDFEVDGIYYNIGSTTTEVEVTYQGSSYTTAAYSGDVVIPSTVTYEGLTYDVTSIGSYALRSCSGVTSVTIPESVTYIGTTAFGECTSLTSITIPNSVTSLGNSVFSSCTALASVTLGSGLSTTGNYTFSKCTALESITLPDNIHEVGTYTFQYSGLKSITLGDSVETTGQYSFAYCYSLADVEIKNISSIANYAFYNSTGLNNLKIKGVGDANIGTYCFSGCTNLVSAYIEGVDTLNTYAFRDCTSLSDLTLTEGLETIMTYVFYNDSALTSVTIPESVGYIRGYAFRNCTGIPEITIPGNGETVLDGRIFQGCWGLRKVTFGKGVANIKGGFYYQCDSITDVYSLNATPPSLTITAFNTYLYANVQLHVPKGAAETYSSTSVWSQFANIIDDIEDDSTSYIGDVSADGTGAVAVYTAGHTIIVDGASAPVEVYTVAGQMVYSGRATAIDVPGSGLYIVKTGATAVKVAL